MAYYRIYLNLFFSTGQAEAIPENRTTGSSVDGTENQDPDSASTLRLPTATLLGETMHSTRQIVVEQAGAMLSVSCVFQSLAIS